MTSNGIGGLRERNPLQPIDGSESTPKRAQGTKRSRSPEVFGRVVQDENADPKKQKLEQQVTTTPANDATQVSGAAAPALSRAAEPKEPMPGGLVNIGNSCYMNSLIKSIHQSVRLNEVLLERISASGPLNIPGTLVGRLMEVVPPKYHAKVFVTEKIKTAEDVEEDETNFNIDEYMGLPDNVRSSALDLLDTEERKILKKAFKSIFLIELQEIFQTIDEHVKVDNSKLKFFRSLARDLGWRELGHKNKDTETGQQDSQEFLNFIFGEVLDFKPNVWNEVPSHNLGIELAAISKVTKKEGFFIPLSVPAQGSTIQNIINNTQTKEPFEPVDYLFNHIVDVHRDAATEQELAVVSLKLRKFFDAIKLSNIPEIDATHELLSSIEDIENVTLEEWERIKAAAKNNYYERQMIDQMERVIGDAGELRSTERRIASLTKLSQICNSVGDTDCYRLAMEILTNHDRFVSAKSAAEIERTANMLKKYDKGIADFLKESVLEMAKLYPILTRKEDLTEEDLEVLACIGKHKHEGKLIFNVNGLKADLAEFETKIRESKPEEFQKLTGPNTSFGKVKKALSALDKIPEYKDGKVLREFFDTLMQDIKDKNLPKLRDRLGEFQGISIGDVKTKAQYEDKISKIITAVDSVAWVAGKEEEMKAALGALNARHNRPIVDVSTKYTVDENDPPAILPVSLNRYTTLDGESYMNHDTPIVASPTIELKLTGRNDDLEVAEYRLKAVIVHQGSSPKGGHYFTYAPQGGSHWIEHNDSNVRAVDISKNELRSSEIITKRGYVYIYEFAGIVRKDEQKE